MGNTTKKVILYCYLIPLLGIAAYSSWNLHQLSNQRAEVKTDFSKVNSLQQGLLSVNTWKEEVTSIITTQIDSFDLSQEQDSVLRMEVSKILNRLISKADSVVQHNDKGLGKTLRKWAVNIFIDKDELRSEVPGFSEAIISEVQKPESKERLKNLAREKLDELAQKTYDKKDSLQIKEIMERHGTSTQAEFNNHANNEASMLENKVYELTFLVLGIVVLFLIPWIIIHLKNWTTLQRPLFSTSIALAIVLLVTGVSTAMIEIDARLSEVDFVLLGESVKFKSQILFYRSKSILEVVEILLKTKKLDSVLVGGLILAFSILFPVSKLLATEVFLFGPEKARKHGLVRWLAFKSGKWSMADVMVVAIFMAYVGFNGILNNQMENLNSNTDSLTSIATNQTSLQPGFIIFVSFVLYSLFISALLKWLVSKRPDEKLP